VVLVTLVYPGYANIHLDKNFVTGTISAYNATRMLKIDTEITEE